MLARNYSLSETMHSNGIYSIPWDRECGKEKRRQPQGGKPVRSELVLAKSGRLDDTDALSLESGCILFGELRPGERRVNSKSESLGV